VTFQEFTQQQWILGMLTALFVGFSKTGIPGAGVLVVPLMATAFGGRLSVGALLPMLIMGDCFAMLWYRKHAKLDHVWKLAPWVIVGMLLGSVLLWALGERPGKDLLNPIIGWLVLAMLAVNLGRRWFGERFAPHSPGGVRVCGSLAGFSTTVSNAGGPVMTIYLQGMGLAKEQMMGTNGWYFFIFNLLKIPIYVVIYFLAPQNPIWTGHTLLFDLMAFPVIAVGAVLGRQLLPRMNQRAFDFTILFLAAVAAIKLIV